MGQEVAQRRRTVERKCGYSGKLSSALARCQAAGQRRISLLRRPLTTSSSLGAPYSALIKYSFSKTRHLRNQRNRRVSAPAGPGERGRLKKTKKQLRTQQRAEGQRCPAMTVLFAQGVNKVGLKKFPRFQLISE